MKVVTEATRADIFYPQIDFHWILVEEHHLYKVVTICINMVGLCIKTLFAGQISPLKLWHILIFWTKLVTLFFETNLKSARPEPGLRLSHFSSGLQYSRLGQLLVIVPTYILKAISLVHYNFLPSINAHRYHISARYCKTNNWQSIYWLSLLAP